MRIIAFLKKIRAWIAVRFKTSEVFYINGNDNLPPPLTATEEENFINSIDIPESRDALIEHNLRLVVYIAKKFENTGIDFEDLISIGTIGLMKAINSFNASFICLPLINSVAIELVAIAAPQPNVLNDMSFIISSSIESPNKIA